MVAVYLLVFLTFKRHQNAGKHIFVESSLFEVEVGMDIQSILHGSKGSSTNSTQYRSTNQSPPVIVGQ